MEPTKFLHNLLTTTPPTSHVSDFRGQRKTDSRADKPDTFPGFDLHEDGTTVSPHKRRHQAYSKLIQLFIVNTKDRLETIRDVIKDESELHVRLVQPPYMETGANANGNGDGKNDKIRFLEETNYASQRQFIDTAYGAENDANEMANDGNNVTQTYLNSLFAAIGYSRITPTSTTTTTTAAPIIMEQDNLIARYVLNPLFRIWYSALPMSDPGEHQQNDVELIRTAPLTRTEHRKRPTPALKINDGNIVDMDTITKMKSDRLMDKTVNGSYVDGFNYRVPLVRLSSNSTNATVPMASLDDIFDVEVDGMNNVSHGELKRSNANDDIKSLVSRPLPSVAIHDAASAFRNAFYKYSNYMQRPILHRSSGNVSHTAAVTSVSGKLSETHSESSTDLLDANVILGNIADAKPGHIQVIRAKQHRPHENAATDGYVDDGLAEERTEATATEPLSAPNSFGENAGVLIFEMIGTVAGMTWNALTQLPTYWNRDAVQRFD